MQVVAAATSDGGTGYGKKISSPSIRTSNFGSERAVELPLGTFCPSSYSNPIVWQYGKDIDLRSFQLAVALDFLFRRNITSRHSILNFRNWIQESLKLM